MVEGLEIKGGAGVFEAAVIAILLDHIGREENAARLGTTDRRPALPAWVRAESQERPDRPRQVVWPDGLLP